MRCALMERPGRIYREISTNAAEVDGWRSKVRSQKLKDEGSSFHDL
jgi:hypothetical protein